MIDGQHPGAPCPARRAELRIAELLEPRLLGAPSTRSGYRSWTVVEEGRTSISLGDPGWCPPHSTNLFVILDGSPSVTSPGGNDPLSRRHEEAAHAIAHVAAVCRCKRERVSLLPFDLPSAGYVPPQPMTRTGLRRLHAGLRAAARGCTSSDLDPALTHAERMAARTPVAAALVVFSDFLLTDNCPNDVLNRLVSFPGYVHAVVLAADPPALFLRCPEIAHSRIMPTSPPGAAARAMFEGLVHYRGGRTRRASCDASPDLKSAGRKEVSDMNALGVGDRT